MRVGSHENPPDHIAAVDTDDPESGEDGAAWAETECTDGEWDSKRAENIGGDLVQSAAKHGIFSEKVAHQVEYGAP